MSNIQFSLNVLSDRAKHFALEQVINRMSCQVVEVLLVVNHELKTCYLLDVRHIIQMFLDHLNTRSIFKLTMEMLSVLLGSHRL